MIAWADGIPVGITIDSVKKLQPRYIKIPWERPEKSNNETKFSIEHSRGNSDALKMANYLIFIDNKYEGRRAHK